MIQKQGNTCLARLRRGAVVTTAIGGVFISVAVSHAQWAQWGGPHRNFTSAATGLASKWSADGPKRVKHDRLQIPSKGPPEKARPARLLFTDHPNGLR